MKPIPFLRDTPFFVLFLAALTLGLAPFRPQPHLVEKLMMLSRGELKRALDIFDLVLHAAPFLLIALKVVTETIPRKLNKE